MRSRNVSGAQQGATRGSPGGPNRGPLEVRNEEPEPLPPPPPPPPPHSDVNSQHASPDEELTLHLVQLQPCCLGIAAGSSPEHVTLCASGVFRVEVVEAACVILDTGGHLTASSSLDTGGHLTASSSLDTGGHLTASSSLDTGGHITASSSLDPGGHITASSSLDTGGHITASSSLDPGGHLTASSSLDTGGHLTASSSLDTGGHLSGSVSRQQRDVEGHSPGARGSAAGLVLRELGSVLVPTQSGRDPDPEQRAPERSRRQPGAELLLPCE
ncbi:unnamed protein product [Pleuronectes platessa]|uniref:Uncharacterized protein n=1 Tax=Pleuronectes platessa TaxID=8262 RepID=A0A9N7Y9A8_PLEPL|nr:unnamed protein product [Pleuronectes platessa]